MELAHKLGILYKKAKTRKEKNEISNFWWYVFEFGLIKEGEVLKAFGAGLMSSKGEREHAFSKNVKLNKFNLKKIKSLPPSAHEFHKELFVIDSFEQIKDAVNNWHK
jgi:phenylalanine-4-hydroxylase